MIELLTVVNEIYDISDIFKLSDNATDSVSRVLETIPTRGYSNYYMPFKEFSDESLYKVTRDSIVFFIGDARNNKNPSGEEYVKRIARKARKAYWLDTEEREKWNKADSIIDVYGKYMDRVAETVSTRQLLDFLMDMR